MLVYLMQIGYSNKRVKFYYPHSVKFSSHTNSISIIYGNSFKNWLLACKNLLYSE